MGTSFFGHLQQFLPCPDARSATQLPEPETLLICQDLQNITERQTKICLDGVGCSLLIHY